MSECLFSKVNPLIFMDKGTGNQKVISLFHFVFHIYVCVYGFFQRRFIDLTWLFRPNSNAHGYFNFTAYQIQVRILFGLMVCEWWVFENNRQP